MNLKSAISAIEKHGILLVFPHGNQKDPPSLWSTFFPRSPMRWEWDEAGDQRVSELWRLREELSRSKKVVYSKWYQGRATFFSKKIFIALLSAHKTPEIRHRELSAESRQILQLLEMDSPLSTKQIKQMTELKGRVFESIYTKSVKQLWNHLLIVGFGEIDDGAFPSLGIGATRILFEDLWKSASTQSADQSWNFLEKDGYVHPQFIKQLRKLELPVLERQIVK
jgi:hypothetical protein